METGSITKDVLSICEVYPRAICSLRINTNSDLCKNSGEVKGQRKKGKLKNMEETVNVGWSEEGCLC